MVEKLINVFFDANGLPYKDIERQVHFPIVGGAFLGASNTTKIRFYFDYIGDSNTTWVSVAKLPNGKQGSRVLPIASDENGNYAELELSNWYTQAKGDVYIALQGYQGGVEYTYDSETELYEIHGTPTIQTTGSIKLAINYAPIGDSPDYNDEFSTYQDILALLGDKADADNVYDKTEVDSALNGKVDKRNTTGQFLYGHRVAQEIEVPYSNFVFANYLVQRDDNGEINVPTTPSDNNKATSKSYVDSAISSGLATKQDRLVSGTNIKTINGQSVLGSGDLEVGGSGSAEWGAIGGDIQEQTDLQNELQGIREVAEGKTSTYVLSLTKTVPSTDYMARQCKKYDTGENFADLADFNSYVSGLSIGNSLFNSTSLSFIDVNANYYLITNNDIVIRINDLHNKGKYGDNVYIEELDVPDRWLGIKGSYTIGNDIINFCGFYPLETNKVDLSGYATKTELSESIENLAQPYDSTTIYSIGDKVIYDNKLYSCLVNMSAAESWDATHWMQITVASGFVDLDKAQVISGQKTFTVNTTFSANIFVSSGSRLYSGSSALWYYYPTKSYFATDIAPIDDNLRDIGDSTHKVKDLYLGNKVYIGTSGAYIGTVGQTFGLYGYSTIRTSGTFSPVNTNTDDLGQNNRAYKDLYLGGTAYASNFTATNTTTSIDWGFSSNQYSNMQFERNGAGMFSMSSSAFFPNSNNSRDLGTSALRFRDAYINRNITDGTNSVSVADLANLIAYAKAQGWIS